MSHNKSRACNFFLVMLFFVLILDYELYMWPCSFCFWSLTIKMCCKTCLCSQIVIYIFKLNKKSNCDVVKSARLLRQKKLSFFWAISMFGCPLHFSWMIFCFSYSAYGLKRHLLSASPLKKTWFKGAIYCCTTFSIFFSVHLKDSAQKVVVIYFFHVHFLFFFSKRFCKVT